MQAMSMTRGWFLIVAGALVGLPTLLASCSGSSGGGGDGGDGDTDTETSTDTLDCAGGRYQPSADLCWQQPRAYGFFDWEDAIAYCEELELEGHSDWFLPAIQDFIGLLGGCDVDVTTGDSGYCTPCYQSETCGEILRPYTGGDHWSSSAAVYPWGEDAWFVAFNTGRVQGDDLSHEHYARCVRVGN